MKRFFGRGNAGRLTALGLIICLVSMYGSNLIQTDFGKVVLKPLRVEADSGHLLAANLYVPPGAPPETPAPAIVIAHGWFNNKEVMDLYAVEYARRGYVVLSIDMYSHGNSQALDNVTLFERAIGMYDAVKYVATLPYVDRGNIGVTGHSNGGWACNLAVLQDNKYGTNLISNVYLISKDADYVDEEDNYINTYGGRNVGIFAGTYDDYFFVEYQFSKAFIEGKINGDPITSAPDFLKTDIAKSFALFGQDPAGMREDVEPGRIYEATIDGVVSTRSIDVANQIHCQAMLSTDAVGYGVKFFERVMPSSRPLPPDDQIWPIKTFFGVLGMIGFFTFVIYLALLLTRTGPFADLSAAEPVELRPAPTDSAGKKWLLVCLLINLVFPIFSAVELVRLRVGFGVGSTWTQQLPYYMAMWALVNCVVILLTLIMWYYAYGKKVGVPMADYHGTTTVRKFLKSLVVALAAVAAGYLVVFFANYAFNTDFRFWRWAIRSFDADRALMVLKYAPAFIVFWVLNSLLINCLNYNQLFGKSWWTNTFVWALVNMAPAFLIMVYGYCYFFATGYSPNIGGAAETPDWLTSAVPVLFISTFFSRKLFYETRNPYIGGFLNGLIMAGINCATAITIAGAGVGA